MKHLVIFLAIILLSQGGVSDKFEVFKMQDTESKKIFYVTYTYMNSGCGGITAISN